MGHTQCSQRPGPRALMAREQEIAKYAGDPGARASALSVVHMFREDAFALRKHQVSTSSVLAPQDLLGLWSCSKIGMIVHSWSYSPIDVFRHSGLVLRQADELFPLG